MSDVGTTKTHLLSLPNELFPCLLNYLSAAEILKAFLELSEHNQRLASLITPYLSYVNLSHQSNFWLSTRLPKFKDIIYSACVTIRQLAYLRDLPSLESLTIVDIYSTDDLEHRLRSLSDRLPLLRSIKLKFCSEHGSYTLDHCFDNPLEEFDASLNCSFIPTGCLLSSLRHLTTRVTTIQDLFQLGQQLPMIESLRVSFAQLSHRPLGHVEQFNSFTACSPYLKKLVLYSENLLVHGYWSTFRPDFEYLEPFIRGCSSSLEHLTLDIILPKQSDLRHASSTLTIVDGDRLEQGVIAFLPRLKQLDFLIELELDVKNIPKYQRSFASNSWLQRCIVVDYPVTENLPTTDVIDMVVFSVYHTSTLFEESYISSSRIADWHLNIDSIAHRNSLVLTNVNSITILPVSRDVIFTLDLFRWISKTFPRLRYLQLVRKENMNWQLEDETISYPLLNSVRKISFTGQFTCELIYRFLAMCPRLIYLRVSNKAHLKQLITDEKLRNDPYMKNIYTQILEIEYCGRGDSVDLCKKLRATFPRAYLI